MARVFPTDERFMRRALALAGKARGRVSPNPMVGAVIVKGGRIIAEGYHRRCGEDHAEVVALKKIGGNAKGAVMYVTLEPCHHFGRTPPCVDAVIKSGVERVVVAMVDPDPRTRGKSVAKMRRAGIEVVVGVRESEARALNEIFIKFVTAGMPFVAVKFAQSLDGKIATAKGESKWITADDARAYARKQRDLFDAILAGKNTVLKDDPELSAADPSRRIKKIVVDSRLEVSLKHRLFKTTDPGDCFVAVGKDAPRRKVRDFRMAGVNVIVCPLKQGRISVPFLFRELSVRGITSVLVEGGGKIVGNVLREGLADKVYAYVAPKIIGDAAAPGAVEGSDPCLLKDAVRLTGVKIKKFKTDLLLEGYVFRHR